MMDPDTIRAAIDALGGCDATSDLLHTNSRTVRRWYAGKREPGLRSLEALGRALLDRAASMQNLAITFGEEP